MLNDGAHLLMARTEPPPDGGTSLVVWDLPGNQPVRRLRQSARVGGLADPVSFVVVSSDDRYAVLGAQSSSVANFLVLDILASSAADQPPTRLVCWRFGVVSVPVTGQNLHGQYA